MNKSIKTTYDLIVIGGGSGGMSTARKAAALGKKVALLDYVLPSTQGTTWGIAGTCPNVGCIPKKLMHYSALFGELRQEQYQAGWDIDTSSSINWERMRENVNQNTRLINKRFEGALKKENVEYINKLGYIVDNNTVKGYDPTNEGSEELFTAENIVIATGARPRQLDIPGLMENAVTSDDIFWKKEEPGKTLVIGAGYIGLECTGFLSGMGYEVTTLSRGKPLASFDQDMVSKILKKIEHDGAKILENQQPVHFEKLSSGRVKATWEHTVTGEQTSDEFDTILLAAGRTPNTKDIGLENVGIETVNGYIDVDDTNSTGAKNIWAVGDVLYGKPSLTPVAIKQGRYLVSRIFNNLDKKIDYDYVATTVFTPVEYAMIGLSEEQAIEKLGIENVDVFVTDISPGDWAYSKFTENPKPSDVCGAKMIVDKSQDNKVVGLHYVGTNAGEVMQGYAVAVTAGLNKEAFDRTIPIHPTNSEDLVLFKNKKDIHYETEVNKQIY